MTDKIKAAVIGVGYLGSIHARIYHELKDVDLIGVVDTDPERQSIAKKYKVPFYTSIEPLLDQVDVVSITVPTSLHNQMAMPFIRAGKGLLIEKPLSDSVANGRELCRAAKEAGVIVQVGHVERYNPAILSLKGLIIEPMFVEFTRIGSFSIRGTDVDVVKDLMIHDLDLINSLINQEITSIDAIGMPVLTSKIDIANARIVFANGCRANVVTSRVSLKKERKIRLFQPNGYFSVDLVGHKVSHTYKTEKGIEHRSIPVAKHEPLKLELQDFITAFKQHKTPEVDAEAGLRALVLSDKVKHNIFVPRA